ncbi:uncharacterized protein J4E78_004539 [Alternaria triticimaculans]|uniref:uncharacterized protein n=1 Tax=Alternaria triticimaculans TaxID=297637 RepID=UPI0020C21CE8|nr:uncharacterized protein J4E78_004539 [Alternaria triticimaculans]KAI4661750.1 hypothetical protein J4E78_004539 [Alternaria triticimaculans]
MKPISILMAFASTGAFASAINFPNLQDRAIDPATMNPTLLSVLSVLKTAMPTGPNAPMPTGDMEPNWYQKLPGDVKSLLPELYPAAAVATSEAGAGVSASTITDVVSPSSSELYSESASPTASSATLASASATPSNSPSTGNRFVVRTETLAAIAMFSVGAGFCIFA